MKRHQPQIVVWWIVFIGDVPWLESLSPLKRTALHCLSTAESCRREHSVRLVKAMES